MKRIKTLLIISIVIALSFSMIGCGLLGSRGTTADVTSGAEGDLPEWLLLSHRAEAVEEPEVEEEEALEEEMETEPEEEAVAETPPVQQPTQPSQPAQPAQPTQTSGTPRYLQPGTMEYIAKMKLDEAVSSYKRLLATNTSDMDSDQKAAHSAKLKAMWDAINEVAGKLGVDLQKEYGITATSASSPTTSGDSGWFTDWSDSPSGWGN